MVGADPGGLAAPDAQVPAPRRRLLGRRAAPGAGEAMDALATGVEIATALRDGLTAPAASGAARRLRGAARRGRGRAGRPGRRAHLGRARASPSADALVDEALRTRPPGRPRRRRRPAAARPRRARRRAGRRRRGARRRGAQGGRVRGSATRWTAAGWRRRPRSPSRPSCGRCARRSRRTSSTTASPRSRRSSRSDPDRARELHARLRRSTSGTTWPATASTRRWRASSAPSRPTSRSPARCSGSGCGCRCASRRRCCRWRCRSSRCSRWWRTPCGTASSGPGRQGRCR